VRASINHIRYAILELDAQDAVLWVNLQPPHEHKWVVPKAANTKAKRLVEVHREICRIIDKYQPDHVAVKVAENVQGGPSPDRVRVEAVVMLACGQRDVPVAEKLYSQLKPNKSTRINSKNVQADAFAHVGQPRSYWDSEIADAIVAALRELGK
jgi:Holliday junction resolvasome RuvABC endonuclease subunit